MTDYPRFEPASYRPDDVHRWHNGGCLVDLAVGIVDHRTLQRPTGQAPHTRKFVVGVLIALVLLLIAVFAGFWTEDSQRSLRSAAAEMAAVPTEGRDPSPDEDVRANLRRPQTSYSYAPFTP